MRASGRWQNGHRRWCCVPVTRRVPSWASCRSEVIQLHTGGKWTCCFPLALNKYLYPVESCIKVLYLFVVTAGLVLLILISVKSWAPQPAPLPELCLPKQNHREDCCSSSGACVHNTLWKAAFGANNCQLQSRLNFLLIQNWNNLFAMTGSTDS